MASMAVLGGGICNVRWSTDLEPNQPSSSRCTYCRSVTSFSVNVRPRRHGNHRSKQVIFAILADPEVQGKCNDNSSTLPLGLEDGDEGRLRHFDLSETRSLADCSENRFMEGLAMTETLLMDRKGRRDVGPSQKIKTDKKIVLEKGLIARQARQSESSSAGGMGLSDSSLESTWEHRLWVGAASVAVVGMVAKACLSANSFEGMVEVCGGTLLAYVLSDLGTGFYHWGIDNYGDASTPVFGSQIDAFQGHHKRPWTITKRQFANNIHAIARPASMFLAPFLLLPSHPLADSFLGVFLGCVVMSQQFHAWSHMKTSQLPTLVIALQDRGILVSRKMHGAHHNPPYDINYCIVSGIWNPTLEKLEVFKRLERYIYTRWRVPPRAWSETSDEWLQEGAYFEDGSELDSFSSS